MTNDEKTKLAQELVQMLSQFKQIGSQAHADQEVRQSEFRLLFTLLETDATGIKVSDLSMQMQITPGAVTHMLNPLEEGGYIARLADPADRRVVLVKLTDKGKHTVETLKAKFLEKLTGLVGFLGERDVRELLRLVSATLTYFKDRQKEESPHA
jgi:DNA-binding MarR family transcriptional regulator